MKLANYFLIPLIFLNLLLGRQIPESDTPFLTSPKILKTGIVVTDNLRSTLYLVTSKETKSLLSARGCGNYFTLSPTEKELGIKLIDDDGRETPALLDISTQKITPLAPAATNAGQVSFSNTGLIAYTLDNNLYLSDGRIFDLGTYSNLAPISPNADYVAFNNDQDQIFLLNLTTGEKTQITPPQFSYYYPQWSPEGNQLLLNRFDGKIVVYNLKTQQLTTLADGHNPTWQSEETILFYQKEIENMRLVNTDLYSINSDGSQLRRLTDTKETLEVDPVFDSPTGRIIYNDLKTNRLTAISTEPGALNKQLPVPTPETLQPFYPEPTAAAKQTQNSLEVPYIHQVYDVPDWFWGYYACAPTTSAMLMAYYKILPQWRTRTQSGGRNDYSRYICEKYHYNEHYFSDGSSPNGHATGYGGYGYMWGTGSSPNGRMLKYHKMHGITGSQSWDSQGKWSEVVADIEAGYPYTLCVWLTGSGHLVLGKGIVENKHSVIVNDPYGNRNTPGYPSKDGKGAIYDWPGYNHGNINLAYAGSGLPWAIRSRYEVPAAPDTLIDDFHLEQGFTLNTDSPASMLGYYDKKSGYNGHFWYIKSQYAEKTHFAEWNPELKQDGNYELSVYIPAMTGKTQQAIYRVFDGNSWEEISVNQAFYDDQWVSLGLFSLEAGNETRIQLTDSTNSDGENIAIDALKWNYVGQWTMDFSASQISGAAPLTVEFEEMIEYSSDNCQYSWNFGDGFTSDKANPVHIYKNPGNYNVELTLFIGPKEYNIAKENYIEVTEKTSGDFELVFPPSDTVITQMQPGFCWQPAETESASYRFYLHTTSEFPDSSAIDLDTNYYQPAENLTDNTEYFWKVETLINNDTLTSKTAFFRINAANEAPRQFALTFPQHDALLKSKTCTFQWEKSSDNDPYDEVEYDLNLWRDSTDSLRIYRGRKTFFSDTLQDNSIYQWHVIARDKHHSETLNTGGDHRFIINQANDAPSVVTLKTPADNSTISDRYPFFSWTAANDPDPEDTLSYEIYIFKEGRETSGARRQADGTSYNNQIITSESRYGWTVKAMDMFGGSSQSDTFYFHYSKTAIDDMAGTPREFKLYSNYPNPFNPSTTLRFDLPEKAQVKVTIYDLNGHLIEQLMNTTLEAGKHQRIWHANQLSSGVYFYKIEAVYGNVYKCEIQKCLFIK